MLARFARCACGGTSNVSKVDRSRRADALLGGVTLLGRSLRLRGDYAIFA
jgi:hypothetical protein